MNNDCIVKLLEFNTHPIHQMEKQDIKNAFLQNKIHLFKEIELLFYFKVPIYIKNQLTVSLNDCIHFDPQEHGFELSDSDLVRDSSGWPICNDSEFLAEKLAEECNRSCKASFDTYYKLLDEGMSKEQAQKVLPLSSWIEIYWNTDIYDVLLFMKKYFHKNTQIEMYYIFELIEECLYKHFRLIMIAWDEIKNENN
jgi:hypothetical protein